MAEPGIVFDHVWKKFRRGELHDSLRDLLPMLVGRFRGQRPSPQELGRREFWALSDVSFEVRPGEALGIIGANGAGKSTVLKTLNRILRPTRGRCEVRGRAGSLIEISAGFQQDLSGRHNVFLQGAIMGMRKSEIERKFDEIVEFAGLGEFIDTPVKRYSSGMNARLGFAIAAHLDPDVLIIDEVLAVGDFSFQERAFGRIQDLVSSGIPVVLVSHQLDRIATLCTSALLLEKGRVVQRGTPDDVIASYVMNTTQQAPLTGHGTAPVRIDELEIVSALPVQSGDWVRYRIRGYVDPSASPDFDPFRVRVRSAQTGRIAFGTSGVNCGLTCPPPGEFEAEVALQMNLGPGIYQLETMVRQDSSASETVRGPMAYLQVAPGQAFEGVANLNATMRLVDTRVREPRLVGSVPR